MFMCLCVYVLERVLVDQQQPAAVIIEYIGMS